MKKLCFIVLFLVATVAFGQQKYALVIGNGNYSHITKLNNPVNDATDMAATLQDLGFTVDKILNGTQDQMVNAIIRLKNRLSVSKNSYGFVFYAGHGIQSSGENYLIPIDANIPTENFLRNRAVSVQEMLDELNDAGNELNVVILDACRDNPFSWRRSGSRGLSIVGHQPADSIIVYATAAGSTASDGNGRNGLFTSQLLINLKTPDLEVTEIFRRTGADVSRISNGQQRPAVYNQFYGIAFLGNTPTQSDMVITSLEFMGNYTLNQFTSQIPDENTLKNGFKEEMEPRGAILESFHATNDDQDTNTMFNWLINQMPSPFVDGDSYYVSIGRKKDNGADGWLVFIQYSKDYGWISVNFYYSLRRKL